MQSFHRSRGRILFEVFCALAIAESFAGAWMQTHATAFLPAAVVSALYGMVLAFDMFGRTSTVTVAAARQPAPSTAEPEPKPLGDLKPIAEESADAGKPDAAAPKASRPRRAKAATKAGRSRTKARNERVAEPALLEEAKVVEPTAVVETEVIEPQPPREAQVVKLTPPVEVQPPAPPPADETPPVPLTPLFEPQPFVRQQRGMFGRKAG